MLKKSFQTLLAASVAVGLIFGAAQTADAAKQDKPKAESQAAAKAGQTAQADLPYKYESKAFGYSIQCPKEPVGVIPASTFYEGKEGEILVFENEEYNIKSAWIILKNAFTDQSVPDLNKISDLLFGLGPYSIRAIPSLDEQEPLIHVVGNLETGRIADGTPGKIYTRTFGNGRSLIDIDTGCEYGESGVLSCLCLDQKRVFYL